MLKFFLYTRAGSLAMLLTFLGLYLSMEPATFSLPAIVEVQPLAGAGLWADLVLLGMLIGFAVKLPIFPLHNWLPEAHVEAPTEGSVILAGLLLKLGGYGLLRILLPSAPEAAARWGWVLVVLGLISILYGILAALGQSDLKRMIAYTSINHMGFVTLAAGIWALSSDTSVRELALSGGVYQMISHGLLTGAMFFMVGMLGEQAGTRHIEHFGGLFRRVPQFGVLLAGISFGSFGLPGFSGFVAEFQVLGATVSTSLAAAIVVVTGLVITTGLYLRIITRVLMGEPPEAMPDLREPPVLRLATVSVMAALSVVLGIVPGVLMGVIRATARFLAAF